MDHRISIKKQSTSEVALPDKPRFVHPSCPRLNHCERAAAVGSTHEAKNHACRLTEAKVRPAATQMGSFLEEAPSSCYHHSNDGAWIDHAPRKEKEAEEKSKRRKRNRVGRHR